MTVEEAKTKICPFISGVEADISRRGAVFVYCICDSCMAWEWEREDCYRWNPETKEDVPCGFRMSTTDGYCKRIG